MKNLLECRENASLLHRLADGRTVRRERRPGSAVWLLLAADSWLVLRACGEPICIPGRCLAGDACIAWPGEVAWPVGQPELAGRVVA